MYKYYSTTNPWAYPENLNDYERDQVSEFERQLKKFESSGKYIPYPYLCTAGKRTVCYGHNVDDPNTFYNQPYQIGENGPYATLAEKQSGYHDFDNLEYGNKIAATSFKNTTNLRLSEDYCNQAFREDLRERYETLNREFPNYSLLPITARLPILEGHFQTDTYDDEKKWPNLHKGARAMSQKDICGNIRRNPYDENGNIIGNIPERNDWGYNKCMEVPFGK